LPCVASVQSPSAEPVTSRVLGRRLRILLAEDDSEMRRLLSAILRRDNCEVIEAQSGTHLSELIAREGLMAPSDARLDLIISDIRMPGRSGLEVLAGLRRTDQTTPVILITAFGDRDTHADAHRLGALAVFNKPFDLDDLRTLVVSLREH
jgi:DNA-binding NtrC family response regulator